MSKRMLLVAHFCSEVNGSANNRFVYLRKLLAESGVIVDFVTSDFYHTTKSYKSGPKYDSHGTIEYCHEPSYRKNVSVKRVYSHHVFSRNVEKLLSENSHKYDLVYCAVPSLGVAKVCAEYCRNSRTKFFIDLQDLWPEAFLMYLGNNSFTRALFKGYFRLADSVYNTADAIISVSHSYIDRALSVNRTISKNNALCVYLGTDLALFDTYIANQPPLHVQLALNRESDDEVVLVYVGTLGHSYDLRTAIHAISQAQIKLESRLRLLVMGDGPLMSEFQAYANNMGVDSYFTGRLAYKDMVACLSVCDIAINSLTKGAAQSIINKHADYAAAGLPVINNQENIEYKQLLSIYKAGISVSPQDPIGFSNAIVQLCSDASSRSLMGRGSRQMAEEKFDRKRSYSELVGFINESLC